MKHNPSASIADCHSLRQALEEEFDGNDDASFSRLYYDAFQISVAHGDQARAVVFAERAYNARIVCEGEDSLETERMKKLMQNPASHASFGCYSMRCKTKKGAVPNGLDSIAFERWLWKLSEES